MTKDYIFTKIRNYYEKKYNYCTICSTTIDDLEYIIAEKWDEKIDKFCMKNSDLWQDIVLEGEKVSYCNECGRYHWNKNLYVVNEERICKECLRESYIDDYIADRVNNSSNANNLLTDKELRNLGWQKASKIYHCGYYKGHNADPKTILEKYLKDFPKDKFIFSIVDQNPFDTSFVLYHYVED